VTIVESPDRAYSYFHLLLGAQPRSDLVERQIRLLGNEFEQPLLVLLEWRADVAGARLRLDAAGLRLGEGITVSAGGIFSWQCSMSPDDQR
jgi:hypothetical protein